jgi:hypothetical protein
MASQPLPSLNEVRSFPSNAPAIEFEATQPPARLSALEWSIVALGERDSLASLREPGRFLTALGALFGVRRVNRLANDRLESLRRIAVLAWHYRWNVPKSELGNFLNAGFTLDHYELVQNSIGQARAARNRRKRP